ncbi:MAG: S8 family serine peptidase [Candidatus Nitrosopolaris sp.]
MKISSGNPDIKIGLIDGPLDLTHAAFKDSRIRAVKESQLTACKSASSIACRHATFVAGILCAKRGSYAPAICPGCTLLLRPVFMDETHESNNRDVLFPSTTPEELSDAIIEVVNTGASIINLSLGLSTSSLTTYPMLQEAYDYARLHGAIILAASGNQGNIGAISLLNNQWIIPVAACNENGQLDPISNFGQSIGFRGVMAPGINITSTSSAGGYTQMSGTSFATPFVTGALALLWSIFPKARAAELILAIRPGVSSDGHRKSIIPPLVDIESTYHILKSTYQDL